MNLCCADDKRLRWTYNFIRVKSLYDKIDVHALLIHCYFTIDDSRSSTVVFKKIHRRNYILLPKLFSPTVRKNCSSDREKLLKFKAEGLEFAKFLRFSKWFFLIRKKNKYSFQLQFLTWFNVLLEFERPTWNPNDKWTLVYKAMGRAS